MSVKEKSSVKKDFIISYNGIDLRIICDNYIELLVKEHFKNHLFFKENSDSLSFTLMISDCILNTNGAHFKMIDKWFEYATLDCYIDYENRICYATNFDAVNDEFKKLLIQYFVANLFNRFLEINGYLGVHSSCVEQDGSGILFIGGRNSGKTNCMLNLMDSGYNSVTNDKIALKNFDDYFVGYGIAQSVSIRLSPSFCMNPKNKKYVELATSRGIEIKPLNMLDGNNMVINENELAAINGVKQVHDCKISSIIKPIYDPGISKLRLEKMDSKTTISLMREQYLPLVHDTTDFFRTIDSNYNNLYDYSKLLTIVENIPCYKCYQNERTTEEFVDKIRKLTL